MCSTAEAEDLTPKTFLAHQHSLANAGRRMGNLVTQQPGKLPLERACKFKSCRRRSKLPGPGRVPSGLVDSSTSAGSPLPGFAAGCRFGQSGLKSIPLLETSVSVHALRSKQHGLRDPASSLGRATSILFLRVSGFFVERIQRIQSQCAAGVVSFHTAYAFSLLPRALLRSPGTSVSGHSSETEIWRVTVSPGFAPDHLSMSFLTPSQWPLLPSGSRGHLKWNPFIVPSTITIPLDGSFALALLGSLRRVQDPTLESVASMPIPLSGSKARAKIVSSEAGCFRTGPLETRLDFEQNARRALELGDRAYLLVSGKRVFTGTCRELLEHKELGRLYLGLQQS